MAKGFGNGLANSGYQLVTLGYANGNWHPYGGEGNPGQAWGNIPGMLVGDALTVAIPAKYLGYTGRGARMVNIAVKGVAAADKFQNVVVLTRAGYTAGKDVYEGKADANTVFTAVAIGTTLYLIHKDSFASGAVNPINDRADMMEALVKLKAGRSAGVKVVTSEAELEALYKRLSVRGKLATPPTYKGTMVELPDGTMVGLRDASKSGGKTIDVRMPDRTHVKVHIE